MRIYPVILLRCKFEIVDVGGETVAVSVDDGADSFHGIIKLKNESSVFMFKKLQEGITLPQLIKECMDEYNDSSVEEAGPFVMSFLDELKEQGLLVMDTSRGMKVDDMENEN